MNIIEEMKPKVEAIVKPQKEKFVSIQTLKVIGFIIIFLGHARYLPIDWPNFGAMGVEMFILISGFTMMYNHYNDKISSDGYFKTFYVAKLGAKTKCLFFI